MDIFVIDLKDAENISADLLERFQKKEISNTEKRKQHCFSYLMIDCILREVYQIEDREIVFENRKPFLKNRAKFFSISHSEEIIVLAFSDHDCGIDVERIKQRDYEKIAKRMKFKCNTLDEFYQEWTKFEAKYKLNSSSKTHKTLRFEDYMITAVCSNVQEAFEIYIQNGDNFPNVNT